MEAAAEILSSGKSKAAAMPPQKLPGEEVDLGGPTPQNAKPDDDSHKIDATKAAKSATAPTTKPSDASADTQLKMGKAKEVKEEVIDEMMHTDADKAMMKKMEMKKKMKEDIDALFSDDDTISEEFKGKVSTIFEARVNDRVSQIEEETEAKYAGMLEEAIESVRTQLEEKVDDYVNYVVEQWLEENAIAIESGLRAELAEDFISGLHKLFAENYINVPEDKVELVDELATKVEQLESKLNEEIEKSIGYKKSLIEVTKQQVTRSVCEGLTETQVEKIKSLAESVEFSTEEEYENKLETIRENYFPSGVKKADEEQLHEQVSPEDAGETKKQVSADPYVSSVVNAISKTKL
jgi:hypothetical protein